MATIPMTEASVAATTFPANPQVTAEFDPSTWMFAHLGVAGAPDIDVSFDGVTVASRLTAASTLSAREWRQRSRKAWFKLATAGAAQTVRVEAGTDV